MSTPCAPDKNEVANSSSEYNADNKLAKQQPQAAPAIDPTVGVQQGQTDRFRLFKK
jgi:hypothetical protein